MGLLNAQVTGLIVGQAHQGHWPIGWAARRLWCGLGRTPALASRSPGVYGNTTASTGGAAPTVSNIVAKMRACIGQAPKAMIDRDDSDMAIVNSLMSVMVSSEVRPGSQAERTGLISGWDSRGGCAGCSICNDGSVQYVYHCQQRQLAFR